MFLGRFGDLNQPNVARWSVCGRLPDARRGQDSRISDVEWRFGEQREGVAGAEFGTCLMQIPRKKTVQTPSLSS